MKLLALFLLVSMYRSIEARRTTQFPGTTEKLCYRPAEVVFLVDSSRSIHAADFPHELSFVNNMISHFDVSPNTTRVAVITFSRGFRAEFNLDTYTSADAMMLAVAKIPFAGGDITVTYDAIEHARDVILAQSRPDATKIIICITDGMSTNPEKTAQEASLARQQGILIFAVGVGDGVDFKELASMATQNSSVFVMTVDDFQDLSTIIASLSYHTCEVTAAPMTTTPYPVSNNPTQAHEECEDKPVDLVFVLDRSNSINVNDFKKQIRVVQDIVKVLDIARNKTHVAVVAFSSSVTVDFPLNRYFTNDAVVDGVGQIPYRGGDTETGRALNIVRELVLSPQHGGRGSAAARIVIVITDGRSQDPAFTETQATLLKDDGVTMIAVGVGPHVNRLELQNIASKPYEKYLFEVDGYGALIAIEYIMAINACNSTD